MKKLFTTIVILMIVPQLFAEADLYINKDNVAPIWIEFKTVSVSFECLNSIHNSNYVYNRFQQIQIGSFHRRFNESSYEDKNIVYYNSFEAYRSVSCFSEWGPSSRPGWGFAKYLVTLVDTNNSADTFRFYWNSLDSKLGTVNWQGTDYYRDFYIAYREVNNSSSDYGFVVYTDYSSQMTYHDTIRIEDQYKEIKLWDIVYGREEPWERKFYARTTPFPVTPFQVDDTLREFVIGTTIVFDTVFSNRNPDTNKYGFNTVNLVNTEYEYFTNPRIPVQCVNCDSGNVYTTPGIYMLQGNDFLGIKITAEQVIQ